MGKINSITKQTDNRYVNLYNVKATSVHNTPVNYFVSSRAKDVDSLKMVTHKNNPDGVIIYSIYGEKHDKVVLIRQYRYTLGDYIYEFPAGLVEPDENYHEGAIREMYEETGLKLDPIPVAEAYQKPYFTTVGMTDESCATVYGYASGEISSKAQEDTEEIEVTDEVAAAFEQLEKYEKKVERKETRRHISYDKLLDRGFEFPDESEDILDILDKKEREKSEWKEEKFRRHNNDEKKQEIFSLLTYRQADAYFRHKYLHIKKTEIAKSMNVTEGAVRKLIKKAEANLQEYKLAHDKEVKLLKAIFGSVL